MELVDKLQKICQETTCTLFKLSVEANSTNWTLYIYKSKLLYRGSFVGVVQAAIDEFTTFRLDPLSDAHKNYVGKYRYLKKPDGNNYNLKNPSPNRGIISVPKPAKKDSYSLKLEFSKQLGYDNFTQAFAGLGASEFNSQFKQFEKRSTYK